MSESGAQRRLAAILAIDIAGYSARAQADEAAAAADVAALRARIDEACERHGGRLFNSAGDGFMLEFPTASGALDAAEELIAAAHPPIRIGVHMGEVRVTPSGDLLGHGVNVAARIQALASPGSVLISDDVRHAVRGAFARRYTPHGAVRLDKMDETVRVFGLGRQDLGARARLTWRRLRLPLAAAALACVAIAAAGWVWRARTDASQKAQGRIAVLPFAVQTGDPLAKSVASGVADEMATVLNDAQMQTVSAEQTKDLRGPDRKAAIARLGAALLLDGAVSREGDTLKVHVEIEDAKARVTLWSETFTGSAAAPSALETDVASKTTDLVWIAQQARRQGGPGLEASLVADYVHAVEELAFNLPRGPLQSVQILRPLLAQAPDFALGHSTLAVAASLARRISPDQSAALEQEVRREAALSLAKNPNAAEPYLALYDLVPQTDWIERDRLLSKGVTLEQTFPYVMNNMSYFLGDSGRLREAIAFAQSGLASNALHPGAHYKYAFTLADAGQLGAARAEADATYRIRPADWTEIARISMTAIYGTPPEARVLLRQAAAHGSPGEAPALSA